MIIKTDKQEDAYRRIAPERRQMGHLYLEESYLFLEIAKADAELWVN